MAGSQIERAFNLVESLAGEPQGLALQTLAERLDIPKSAAHRMLAELMRLGYVRQNRDNSRYQLSAKLVAQGFRYLASSGADVIQPILDRLAQDSGELVRLGVIDGGGRPGSPSPRARAPGCVTTRTWGATRRCSTPRPGTPG